MSEREEKHGQKHEIDAEWLELLLAARTLGITIEQIREFFVKTPLASQNQE